MEWEGVDSFELMDVVLFKVGGCFNYIGLVVVLGLMIYSVVGKDFCIESYSCLLW